MHPEIAARFDKLEERRKALVDRVRALPDEKQAARRMPKDFSPVEVVMHMALAEKFDLDHMKGRPPEALKGRKVKQTFMYRNAIKTMNGAKRTPTLKAMVPKGPILLEDADKTWAGVRSELRGVFEQCESPDTPVLHMFVFGTLSASDLLSLFEAHHHYHETLFPG